MESKQTNNRLTAMVIIMTGASVLALSTDSEGLLAAVGGCFLFATLCLYAALFSVCSRSHCRATIRPNFWKEVWNETAAG